MARAPLPSNISDILGVLASGDRNTHGNVYAQLCEAVEHDVDWADEAWPRLLPLLRHKDNRVRSIAGQALCGLARSASVRLVMRDLDFLIEATRDEKFVTARHVLLALWQIGVSDAALRKALVARISDRYRTCAEEKNATLVRYDIHCALRKLYDATADVAVKSAALALLPLEVDSKYRKKYEGAWRGA
jgi:hypothetical protein